MTTAIIIPTYNERENIATLIGQILALSVETLHVIVVDDGSPDGTGAIVEELAHHDARVHLLQRGAKLGLGTAYVAGFRRAAALGVDRIMTMDADFSHHPRYIPDLLLAAEQYDIVIGSRYVAGGGTRHWGWERVLLSWGANTFARSMLGLRAHDCTAGFRCYRRVVLESIDMDGIFSNGYSFLIEMLATCERRGWRVGETPILFADRRHGSSKISRQEIFKALYTVMRLWGRGSRSSFLQHLAS
jgi:dolichol-phosphate mannosyltransferase